MVLNDTRCGRQCGLMGVTRHTCPLCPCNYCKRNGHSADKCEKGQISRRTRPVGNMETLPMGIQLLVAPFPIPSQINQGEDNPGSPLAKMQTSQREVTPQLQFLLVEIDRLLPAQNHQEGGTRRTHAATAPASRLRERWSSSRRMLGRKLIPHRLSFHRISCLVRLTAEALTTPTSFHF
jgi:hypothetical protein